MTVKPFTIGTIAGMALVVLAVPLLAQFTSAAETTGTSNGTIRTTPTQACVQAMAGLESARLAHIDDMQAHMKQQMQTRIAALNAAADLSDDAARDEALRKMRDDWKQTTPPSIPTDIQTAMDAVKTACGNTMLFHGMGHGFGAMGRHEKGMMRSRYGQTPQEFDR